MSLPLLPVIVGKSQKRSVFCGIVITSVKKKEGIKNGKKD